MKGLVPGLRMLVTVWATIWCLGLPGPVCADEVDDLLHRKAHNANRLKRFSAEFTVETDQPKSLKNPKTTRIRYRLDLQRIPKGQKQHPKNPWTAEIEVLEPGRSRMRIEGESVSYMNPAGQWTPIVLTPEQQAQVSQMVEPYMSQNPGDQRKHFAMRIVKKSKPLFGANLTTMESVPRETKRGLFVRLEEDLNDDGLPVATRIFGADGKPVVSMKVTKHRKVNGVPVVEASETAAQTPAGEIVSRTAASAIQLEVRP